MIKTEYSQKQKREEVINMYLENGRVLMQGIMLLVSAAIAYFVSLPIGLALGSPAPMLLSLSKVAVPSLV